MVSQEDQASADRRLLRPASTQIDARQETQSMDEYIFTLTASRSHYGFFDWIIHIQMQSVYRRWFSRRGC